VQNTAGAKFHPNLKYPHKLDYSYMWTFVVSKGMGSDENAYSAFDGWYGGVPGGISTEMILRRLRPADEIYVAGLATDHCVLATVLSALKLDFKVNLVVDACRAVNYKDPDAGKKAIEEMRAAGARIVTTEEVLRELAGRA
jgi:nicotinamidase/pyrazinamidase